MQKIITFQWIGLQLRWNIGKRFSNVVQIKRYLWDSLFSIYYPVVIVLRKDLSFLFVSQLKIVQWTVYLFVYTEGFKSRFVSVVKQLCKNGY